MAAYRKNDRHSDSSPEVMKDMAVCCRGTNILFAKYPGGAATQLAARRYNEATALEGVTNAEEIKNAFNSPETISAQEYMGRVRCIFIRCIRLSCCPGWHAINNVSQHGTRKTGFWVSSSVDQPVNPGSYRKSDSAGIRAHCLTGHPGPPTG